MRTVQCQACLHRAILEDIRGKKMNLIVAGLAALTAVSLIWCLANFLHYARTGVKGTMGLPLLGHLPWVQAQALHGFQYTGMKRFGSVFRMWYGSTPHIVITSPEAAKQVLTRCSFRSMLPAPMSDVTRNIFLESLPFAKDMSFHQTLQSYWLPALKPAMLEGYYPIMTRVMSKLVALLDLASEKQQYIDVLEILRSFAVEITGTVGFGICIENLSQHAQQLGGNLDNIGAANEEPLNTKATGQKEAIHHDHLGKRCVKAISDMVEGGRPESAGIWVLLYAMFPWLGNLFTALEEMYPDKGYAMIKDASNELTDVALNLVEKEKQALAASKEGTDTAAHNPGLVPGAFLRHLVREAAAAADKGDKSRMLTDKQMAGNVATFLGAGSETVAITLTHALYYLSLPENETWLVRAQQEVDAFSNKHGVDAVPTLQQLDTEFPVIEACFNESMRIAPSASYTTREVPVDMNLAGRAEAKLKAKDYCQVSLYACNHNPSAWPEPDKYIPARFLPEGQQQYGPRVAGAFMPWGGGTRMCPGRNFAIQEGKLALSQMLKKFTFKVQPGYNFVLTTGVATSPVHGLPVIVQQRSM